MFIVRILFYTLLLFLPPHLFATWKCKDVLSPDNFVIDTGISKNDAWIPEGEELVQFVHFKKQLPATIQNNVQLIALIEQSPLLKKALIVFINSVDPSAQLSQETPSNHVANFLSKNLFNKNITRTNAAIAIADLIDSCERKAFSSFTVDELRFIAPPKRLSLWAAAIEIEIKNRWYDRTDDETVFSWVMADKIDNTEALLWANPLPEDSQDLTVTLPPNADPAHLVQLTRNRPLFKSGEILRDSFRIALENFEIDSLAPLRSLYNQMFKLKDKGAFDKVGDLLDPFLIPREDDEIFSTGYKLNFLETLERLFKSAEFFNAFTDFHEHYVAAAETLLELSRNPKLTQLERKKLSTIAQEKIMSYSIDLVRVGLNFHPPHEYRYRPKLLQMQFLNGKLDREVVPVGHLIQLATDNQTNGTILRP